jgi:hypothetical protein
VVLVYGDLVKIGVIRQETSINNENSQEVIERAVFVFNINPIRMV